MEDARASASPSVENRLELDATDSQWKRISGPRETEEDALVGQLLEGWSEAANADGAFIPHVGADEHRTSVVASIGIAPADLAANAFLDVLGHLSFGAVLPVRPAKSSLPTTRHEKSHREPTPAGRGAPGEHDRLAVIGKSRGR